MIVSIPTIRFSLGLVVFILGLLLVTDCIFKFTESSTNALVERRLDLCETLIDRAIYLIEDDMEEALKELINNTVKNNSDILSLAFNDRFGEVSIESTSHEKYWSELAGDQSTLTQIQLPVYNRNVRWGTLQVRLKTDGIYTALYLLQHPLVKSILFICLFGFYAYSWFIKKIFRYFKISKLMPVRASAEIPVQNNHNSHHELVKGITSPGVFELGLFGNKLASSRKELEKLATREPLTGCLNRHAFFEQFEKDFSEAKKNNTELCCIMADIDNLKKINDIYGYDIGDIAIKAVAKIFISTLRADDIICRYGGDEFCILLIGMNLCQATSITGRMRRTVKFDAGFTIREPSNINITSSFGVTTIKFGADTPEDMVSQAEKALYESQKNGYDQVNHFNYKKSFPDNFNSLALS